MVMSRLNTFLQHAYIADGFADDCEELIHKCLKVDFLRFEAFCDIWKEMGMSCLYQGRTLGAEIAELSEEVIHVAKHYMVGNTSNFEESVAGLFLVYALLNLQPYAGFASLRIVQEDLPAIERIARVARRDRRHDVLYILGSVLVQNAQYHAVLRERGMEYPIRKYLEEPPFNDRFGARPKGVFYRQNEELDIIRELSSLEKRYGAAKTAIMGKGGGDRNLEYSRKDFAKELDTSLKNLITGIIEEDPKSPEEDVEKKESAQSIKQKAMKAKVKPMQHLVGVEDSIKAISKNVKMRSPKKSDIKPTTGKVKTGSPTKPVATSSAKRKATKPIARDRQKKSRITFESDSSNSSLSEDSGDEIDLDRFNKSTHEDTQESDSETQEQEIDIKIDSLPCIIRSEDGGQYYEIEIIDNLGKKQKVPDVTLEKLNEDGPSKRPMFIEDENDDMAELSMVSNGKKIEGQEVKLGTLKRLQKCDLKKTLLKSKFNRLGLLPVANMGSK